MELERMKVQHPTDPARFVFINAREFDPAVHKAFVEGDPAPAEPAHVEPPAATAHKAKAKGK